MNGPRAQAVLFDMDGLLIDSEPLWTVAEIELATRVPFPASATEVGQLGDAFNQIARHAHGKAGATNDHPDLCHPVRQIDGSLPGGIARADQRHILPGAELRFQRRCPVMHR